MMRLLLNKVYTVFFAIVLLSMILVDLVPFYPAPLWSEPDTPLAFLNDIRQFYITTYNDPYFTKPHPSWFNLFTYIELFYQFPAATYLLYKFVSDKNTSGATELHALVFSLGFALTTLTCVWDVLYWDPEVYTQAQKVKFMTVIYGPFFLLPGGMTVDMFSRLHARVSPSSDTVKKNN